MAANNTHATAVVLGDRCVMITGESGSGKTGLALVLIRRFRAKGIFSRLLSDDQLFLDALPGGQLLCRAPDPIAGLVEIRGFQPSRVAFVGEAVLDMVVRLVDSENAPRFQEALPQPMFGTTIACLDLPLRDVQGAAQAVEAWFSLLPFGQSGRSSDQNASK
ncbi:HPr kinase/phosphorylase [Mesorhizobium sp. SB112]|uniref:HPr kinase/phosphorylase n=1 Tax=Mesorhizobium sp. SB112 TaxID=3151853 RepID=UPI0032676DBC